MQLALKTHIFNRKGLAYVTMAIVLAGLYLTSLYSYLLFHSIAEIFSILVAFTIFVITWNTSRFLNSSYLKFIGIAFLLSVFSI